MRSQVQILYRPDFVLEMLDRTKLEELYCDRRLSMMEIATQLGVTHATVLYGLKKHRIARRSWSESTYAKLNPSGNPFAIRTRLTNQQRELMVAGLLLYWAEGKKPGGAIQIANLDGRMLQLFVRFLRQVCQVDERRLRVYVRVHKQFRLAPARRYWAELLTLPAAQVMVYPHTDERSDVSKQWSRYGIATLQFNNTKFKEWLRNATNEYLESWLGTNGRDRASYVAEAVGTYDAVSPPLVTWATQARPTS